MKNTLLKVWGIVLTLAILSGLLMASVPVAAGTNSWTTVTDPTFVMGTDTNMFTVAADGSMFLLTPTATAASQAAAAGATTLNVGSTDGFPAAPGSILVGGNTVAYSAKTSTSFTTAALPAAIATADKVVGGGATVSQALYRSSDAGKTWSTAGLTTPATKITMLEVCPTNTNQLVATDGVNLFRSVNGGKTWYTGITAGTILAGSSTINAIDIIVGPSDVLILVGTDIGVAQLDPAVGSWNNLGSVGVVYAVAFSPDYLNDEQVLAVVLTGGNAVLMTKFVGIAFNLTLSSAILAAAPALVSATIAFPSNYFAGSNNQTWVGLNTGAGTGDIYRVTGKLTGTAAVVKDSGSDQDVTSIVVNGTSTNSTITIGTPANGIWYSSDADTVSAPTWAQDLVKGPYGNNIKLALSNGVYFAGTNGTNNNAFFKSVDGKVYNGIAFNEVTNVFTVGLVVMGPTAWLLDGTISLLLQNTADGWQLILNNGTAGWGAASGAPGSKTMYILQNATNKQLLKTIDGGQTWEAIATPGNKPANMLKVIDDNTYWIGYNDGTATYIRKNTSVALTVSSLISENPGTIDFVGDTGILVKTVNGPNLLTNYYYSSDSGTTFNRLGTQDRFKGRPTAYDAANKTLYTVEAGTLALFKWVLGSSTDWVDTKLGIAPSAAITDVKYVSIVGGVLIMVVTTPTNADPQMYRNTSTVSPEYRAVPNSTKAVLLGAFNTGGPSAAADGSYNYNYTITLDSALSPLTLCKSKAVSYNDTAIAPIVLTAPFDQIAVNNPVTFMWNAAPSVTPPVTYVIEVAYDSAFTQKLATYPAYTNNLTVIDSVFTTGKNYYWRVRVEAAPGNTPAGAGTGLTSKWSETRSFTIKTIGSVSMGIDNVDSVYPTRGQVGISTLPVLTWGIVPGAVYNIKIATDSSFSNIVDSKDGLTVAVYTPAKALDPNKTYYWQVQAVANGIGSDWVAFAFTTVAPPAPTVAPTVAPPVTIPAVTPNITVNVPTQPVQPPQSVVVTVQGGGNTGNTSTPAWAWIVIAIGAVLVIAVIVLIVRTRRV
jgi:hypothetical protein